MEWRQNKDMNECKVVLTLFEMEVQRGRKDERCDNWRGREKIGKECNECEKELFLYQLKPIVASTQECGVAIIEKTSEMMHDDDDWFDN